MEQEYLNIIEKYIRSYLGLEGTAIPDLRMLYESDIWPLPIRPDILIKENDALYCVEIKNRATIDAVARLNLYSALIKRNAGTGYNIIPVLAVRTINPRESDLAEEVGIRVIKLPWNLKIKSGYENKQIKNTVRITSEKSWKIISCLLKEPSSIRQISKKEEVSYGWAHKTVHSLLDQNIAEKDGYLIKITDPKKLLTGIAWERPMKNLLHKEIYVDYQNSHETAVSVTKNLEAEKIPHAFTGRTAGGLYSGYAFRHDSADLYLEKADIPKFTENFESDEKSAVKILIYIPDRDVFSSTVLTESVRLVLPEIALLDLAGMGYKERDLTNEMLKAYGRV